MDELDLLLEELALNPAGVDENRSNGATSRKEPGATTYAGLNKPAILNVYSRLPAPVAASSDCDSSTKELDSILEDLMGLGQGEPSSSSTPTPLTQRQSGTGKAEGELKENKESTSAKDSDEKSSKQSKQTDALDDLLGGLGSELEKMGISTTAKGHCAACNKSIVGKMITALGEVWHPEHFVCVVCKKELGTKGFFEREGRPYCDSDYQQLFSPRCSYCKGPIVQKILTALDQTWHPEHFFCTYCGGLFGDEGFLEKDGKPYCPKDFSFLFAPKCSGCGESVHGNYLNVANDTWHPECFVCADCLKPFSDGCFMELDGRALCSLHFHSRQGTLCGSCNEPIKGRCISALDRKFHPEHFVCAFCLRQLNQGIYKEEGGKPYCMTCFNKLFVSLNNQ
ncbi:leupaxin [Aulostomus maculatus]